MKFSVDREVCIGCGACESTCPDVFEQVDGKSHVKLNPVPEAYRGDALQAEEGCPVGAIAHV